MKLFSIVTVCWWAPDLVQIFTPRFPVRSPAALSHSIHFRNPTGPRWNPVDNSTDHRTLAASRRYGSYPLQRTTFGRRENPVDTIALELELALYSSRRPAVMNRPRIFRSKFSMCASHRPSYWLNKTESTTQAYSSFLSYCKIFFTFYSFNIYLRKKWNEIDVNL